ncbi:hypothetical protein BEP19_00985 [Ammoniphilus oxalaticus]|uniref:histidine kinase n=1 Tax=Ammoniphilus oxalaticus TaxID=66863 RepID=A0A419SMV4_9BACL|nr:PAS domain S-box protein [Ammoniphilus oxalaticus]RKD25549.1 hypothetical protein BEP19_00985 [Ammoniphilus oxalaticus]
MAKDLNLDNHSIFVNAFISASIGMALVSLEGDWLKANQSFCRFLGYTEEELMTTPFQAITHPDDVETGRDQAQKLISGQVKCYQSERRYLHKSGKVIWGLLTLSLVEDELGKPLQFFLQIQDITAQKKAETQLKLEQQRYCSLFEYHPDLVMAVSMDGKLVQANAAFERITGYSPEEITYPASLVVPEDLERMRRHFELTYQGKSQQFEITAIHKMGKRVMLRVTSIPIIEEGKLVGKFCIAKDVTVFKQKSQKLRELEQLYRLISENAQDIITLTNRQGVFCYIAPSVQSILGYAPDEVIGRPASDFLHPEDAAILSSPDYIEAFNGNCIKMENRMRHKDGHYLWIETTLKLTHNEQGEIQQVIGVGRDITERKQAEEELRKTKERLEAFFKNSADAMWLVDLDDQVSEVNATFETMFGWHTDEVVGNTLPIVPEQLLIANKQLHHRVKAGESMISFETLRQRKDGSSLYVSTTLSPIRDAKGNVVGISGVCRDVTSRKTMEKQARAAQAQLESFIDNHSDAVIISSENGQIIRVNRAFERLFGWTAEEVINQH